MRKIKVVVLLVRQLQHGFTKNAKVSPNLTVTQIDSAQRLPLRNHRKLPITCRHRDVSLVGSLNFTLNV